MKVRLLRAWYFLRELMGQPRRLDGEEFDRASSTVLLAGSPWVWVGQTASTNPGNTITFAVTNTTWPLWRDDDTQEKP